MHWVCGLVKRAQNASKMRAKREQNASKTQLTRVLPNDYRPYHKPMAIKSQGESRQIAANHGISHSKDNGDHFFEKLRPIASQRAFQKSMAITLKVKFQLFLVCTILVHAGQFFFQFKVQGGFGSWSVSHQAPIKFSINCFTMVKISTV